MLTFVDLPNGIRLIRVNMEEGNVVRTALGRIPKGSLQIEPALADRFEGDERADADQILAGYAEAEILERRLYALTLPVILRKALEYLEGEATDVERKFITGALVEAVRWMRKYEKDGFKG